MSYRTILATLPGAQHPIKDRELIMAPNNDGGVGFSMKRTGDQAHAHGDSKTCDKTMTELLRRVMIMGTNTTGYAVSVNDLTADAMQLLDKCVKTGRQHLILQNFREVYGDGLAPKLGFALATLAYLTSIPDTVSGSQQKTAEIRAMAYKLVPTLRIGTHFHQWNAIHMVFCKKHNVKGTGAGYRKAVLAWFTARTGQQLAYQVTKYGSRDGLSFKDEVRFAHPKPSERRKNCRCKKRSGTAPCDDTCQAARYTPADHHNVLNPEHQIVLSYVAHGLEAATNKLAFLAESVCIKNMSIGFLERAYSAFQYLCAVDCAKSSQTTTEEVVRLIGRHQLPREGLNTEHLRSPDVWTALLYNTVAQKGFDQKVVQHMITAEDFKKLLPLVNHFANTDTKEHMNVSRKIIMPITALLRNLAKLSQSNLFDEATHSGGAHIETMVCHHLANPAVLIGGKVHPLSVMSAWAIYRRGSGLLGGLSWYPSPDIIRALNTAFYHSFHTLKGTGLRCLHGIDASGSMSGATTPVSGLSATEVCAVMAIAYRRVESLHSQTTGKPFCQDIGYFSTEFLEYTDEVSDHTTFEEMCTIVQRSDWEMTDIGKMFEFACDQLQDSLDDPSNQQVVAQQVVAQQGVAQQGVAQPVHQWKGFYEVFLVWTDNDVNSGEQPMIVLKRYQELVAKCFALTPLNEDGSMGDAKELAEKHFAKLVVIATVPTEFTIGDPTDPNVLNMSGFDLSGPTILHNFLTGF